MGAFGERRRVILFSSCTNMEFSEYYYTLSMGERCYYEKKLNTARLKCDPYVLKTWTMSKDIHDYPSITYPGMCSYLVASPNPDYSYEKMMSYKSLQAHNYFLCGWVKEVYSKSSDNQPVIVRGRVSTYIYSLFLNTLIIFSELILT